MNEQNKKIVIAGIIATTVLLFGFVIWWQVDFNKKPTAPTGNIAVEPHLMTVQSAESLARKKASEWDAEAKLARITSVPSDTNSRGEADSWKLLFTSLNRPNVSYEINIVDKQITSAAETPLMLEGGELPADIISSEEAIAKVRKIKGYENEKIESVEMIYGPDGQQWFWGVKTGRGVISIKATR